MLELNGNDDDLQRKLAALERAASDMRPAFEVIGRVLVNRIRLCFKLGVDPWGTAWAALKIRNGQPLVDTTRLRQSIKSQVSDTGFTLSEMEATIERVRDQLRGARRERARIRMRRSSHLRPGRS